MPEGRRSDTRSPIGAAAGSRRPTPGPPDRGAPQATGRARPRETLSVAPTGGRSGYASPVILFLLLASVASGAELVDRWLGVGAGLPTAWTSAVAEGPGGRIWVGGPGWVARLDGERVRTWSLPRPAQEIVLDLVPVGTTEAVVRLWGGAVFRVDASGAQAVRGPDGAPLRAAALEDGAGALWVVREGRGWRLDADGAWTEVVGDVDGAPLTRLEPGPEGSLLVGTAAGWYRHADGATTLLVEAADPVDAVVDGPWTWLLSQQPVALWRLRGDEAERVWTSSFHRAYPFSAQGGVAWLSESRALVEVRADGTTRTRTARGGDLHGMVTLDSGGSLWAASYEGLLHLPEPAVERWTASAGLANTNARAVLFVGDTAWVSTWNGLSRMDPDGVPVDGLDRLSKAMPCATAGGVVWTKVFDAAGPAWVAVPPDGAPRTWPAAVAGSAAVGCATAPDGAVWLLDDDQLLRATDQGPPVPVGPLPQRPRAYQKLVAIAPDGRLWAGAPPALCSVDSAALLAGTPSWRCHEVPAGMELSSLIVTERGRVWATSRTHGLVGVDDDGLGPLPSAAFLQPHDLRDAAASPRGGQWLSGLGAVVRVRDTPDGVEVVERLPEWLARTVASVEGITEGPDGALWLASDTGLVRVPESLRARDVAPPTPRVVEVRADGRVLGGALVVPRNTAVAVEVAAAAHRAPGLVRFRHRVDGGPWSDPTPSATVAVPGLSGGRHRLEVAATLDGQRWSPPVAVSLEIDAPWWRRAELWAAALGLLLLVSVGVQAVRGRLRDTAERLRLRVAMDLHDELGAGLASMGLLAGVIARGAGAQTPRLARRIAEDASALGAGLSGIVWSLRPGHDTLGALLDYVEHRARALLAAQDDGAVAVRRSPALEGQRLDLDVLRAVQLVAIEALRNVARHAGARRVSIHLERAGAGLALVIADDGVGIGAPDPAPDRGLGLESMRRRMAGVGGSLEITSAPDAGTRVRAVFRPRRPWWHRRGDL